MNHYPTQDGFKDEREEPEYEPIEISDHSVNGLCPQCGLEVYTASTGGACGEQRDYCPDDEHCGWTSNPFYDC